MPLFLDGKAFASASVVLTVDMMHIYVRIYTPRRFAINAYGALADKSVCPGVRHVLVFTSSDTIIILESTLWRKDLSRSF